MTLRDAFLTAKRAEGRRATTMHDYERVLTRFGTVLDMDAAGAWTRLEIRAYVADLHAQPWAPATVAIHIRYLRAFWAWCHREGYTAEDFSTVIAAPDKHTREESLLTTAEFTRLVQACTGDRWALRDRAIILMLADTGLRRKEFCSLRRAQITFEDDGGWIQLPGSASKNKRDRFVFLGRTSAAALAAYLAARDGDGDPALFISERGPLGNDGLYFVLKRRAAQAGLDPTRVHPHLLRKMFASWWIENGGDEQRLMDIAGWSGPEMLRIYVRLGSRQKLQEAHRQFGPVDRLFDVEGA